MAGIADMDSKDLVFSSNRLTWTEFAAVLDIIGSFMVRGDIPSPDRQVYQQEAAAIHAAAKSVRFLGGEFENIRTRIVAEAEGYQNDEDDVAAN